MPQLLFGSYRDHLLQTSHQKKPATNPMTKPNPRRRGVKVPLPPPFRRSRWDVAFDSPIAIPLLVVAVSAFLFCIHTLIFGSGYVEPSVLIEEMKKLDYLGHGIGPDEDDTAIRPFRIHIPQEKVQDLKNKLNRTRFISPLEWENSFIHGTNPIYLREIMSYWNTTYMENWRKRERLFNSFNQFTTQICGLDVHFVHVKPQQSLSKGKKIIPILLIHTWPGTAKDFFKMIPSMTNLEDRNFVFEVVAPSVPGNTFSEGAKKKGLHAGKIAVIFNEIMSRLNISKYMVHGYGWGTYIGHAIIHVFPDRIIGFHSTMCTPQTIHARTFMSLTYSFSKWFVAESKLRFYDASSYSDTLTQRDSGYMQAITASLETTGAILDDSPAGLAAFFLEKFSLWSNPDWKKLYDGGLRNFDRDELLDVITAYWFTQSTASSMRVFKESFEDVNFINTNIYSNPVRPKTACVWFDNEITYFPKFVIQYTYRNLLQYHFFEKGGHFGILDNHSILTEDIVNFTVLATTESSSLFW